MGKVKAKKKSKSIIAFRFWLIGAILLSIVAFIIIAIVGLSRIIKTGTSGSGESKVYIGLWYAFFDAHKVIVNLWAIVSIALIAVSIISFIIVMVLTRNQILFGKYSKMVTWTSIFILVATVIIFTIIISSRPAISTTDDSIASAGWILNFYEDDAHNLVITWTTWGTLAVIIAGAMPLLIVIQASIWSFLVGTGS